MQKTSCLYSVFPSARCIKRAKPSLHNCTDENTRAALRLTHWLSAASPTQNCLRLQPEPKACRYRCSEASCLQSKYTHLIQDTNDFCKFQIKIFGLIPPVIFKEFLQRSGRYSSAKSIFEREELGPEPAPRNVIL